MRDGAIVDGASVVEPDEDLDRERESDGCVCRREPLRDIMLLNSSAAPPVVAVVAAMVIGRLIDAYFQYT